MDTTKMMLTQRPRAATASSRSCLPQCALPCCVRVMGGKELFRNDFVPKFPLLGSRVCLIKLSSYELCTFSPRYISLDLRTCH